MGNWDGLEEWSAGSQSVFTTGLAMRSHGDSSLPEGCLPAWALEGVALRGTYTYTYRHRLSATSTPLHFIILGLVSSPSSVVGVRHFTSLLKV